MKRLALAFAFALIGACTERLPAELRPPEPPPFDVDVDVDASDDAGVRVDASPDAVEADASPTGSNVTGSVVIPDGGTTSVILAPEDFDVERFHDGPPSGPRITGVTGAWSIPNVPAGTYLVLAGYEQDGLVLDPSTTSPKIVVSGNPNDTVSAPPQKLVRALTVVTISSISSKAAITFVDSDAEDAYAVSVVDFMSKPTYSAAEPSLSSNANVTFPISANLVVPLRYRFRVTAKKNGVAVTQTEDLAAIRTAAPDDT